MTDELKPCPFCGHPATAVLYSNLTSCSNEGCIAWPNYRPIAEWNTRPIEDAQAAEIERLRGALAEISHGPVGYWCEPQHGVKVWEDMMAIANKALKGGD